MRQGLDYLTHIMSLFWYVPSAGRFWKFALVGTSGVLVNMVTLVVLAELFDAHKVIAWMFAVGLSILSNFLLNNALRGGISGTRAGSTSSCAAPWPTRSPSWASGRTSPSGTRS
jgi:hypothetical protein